jgi:hypothetical protein
MRAIWTEANHALQIDCLWPDSQQANRPAPHDPAGRARTLLLAQEVKNLMDDKLSIASDDQTKCPSPDKMSDQQLNKYVRNGFTKFLSEMRPYLIELQTRWHQRRIRGRPFLSYTNWDDYCAAELNYTGRHVNRIISGEALPKPRKAIATRTAKAAKEQQPTLVWTDHDFIHKGAQAIKQLLHPLESDPPRYMRVAAAIAEEITGDAFTPKPGEVVRPN